MAPTGGTINLFNGWSLIRGIGATQHEGGQVNLYPYEKGGGGGFGNILAMGNNTFWVFLML